jgi:hypothetical protein
MDEKQESNVIKKGGIYPASNEESAQKRPSFQGPELIESDQN